MPVTATWAMGFALFVVVASVACSRHRCKRDADCPRSRICVSRECDLNGNAWELTDSGNEVRHFRGGANNCNNSQLLHRCDSDYTNIRDQGFRCCRVKP
ncbi:hypothetical protein ACFL6C_08775 [Myxococcota bacterium]